MSAQTGRPIYYSITGIVPYNDAQMQMHCIKGPPYGSFYGAFTVRPWAAEGGDPGDIANSYLIECTQICGIDQTHQPQPSTL